MKYYMKQKVSFFQDFEIQDEDNQVAFKVHQKRWSWGREFRVLDGGTGEALAEVKQKLKSFLPILDVYYDAVHVATIKSKMSLFRQRYEIEGLGWKVAGDVMDHHYEITDRAGDKIAVIRKKFWAWTDTFEFNILKESVDPPLVIAVILAIDLVTDLASD